MVCEISLKNILECDFLHDLDIFVFEGELTLVCFCGEFRAIAYTHLPYSSQIEV